jgi:solute carrier family 45 protein 1/2/4
VIENFLIEKYSTKTLFSFNFLFYAFCCIAIYNVNSIYAIFPFCTCFGIMLTTLTTLPYQLVSEFHQDPVYVCNTKTTCKQRGIGVDCSLLCSCHFLSQTIVSTFMSYLTSNFGNRIILLVGAFFGMTGFIFVHFFVIFPKKKSTIQ